MRSRALVPRSQRTLGEMENMQQHCALLPGHGTSPTYGINNEDSSETRRSSLWGVPFVALCALSAASIMVMNGVGLGFTSPTLTELGAIDNPNQHIKEKSVESSLFAVSNYASNHACTCTVVLLSDIL